MQSAKKNKSKKTEKQNKKQKNKILRQDLPLQTKFEKKSFSFFLLRE